MESRTIELVSNASLNVYPDNTLSSFTNFLPEQLNFEGQWEVALSEISFPVLYHNITDGKFRYKYDNNDTNLEPMYIPPGMYKSLHEVLQIMVEIITKNQNVPGDPVVFDLDKHSQKVIIRLPSPESILVIQSMDLAHILGYRSGVMLYGNTPHNSEYAFDILRIHSILVYSDIIEYNIIGDTKAPLLRCFPLMSKLKGGELISPNQYMNYRSFDQLQFKKLLKNSFHSVQIELRDATGQLIPFLSVGTTRLTLVFRKID